MSKPERNPQQQRIFVSPVDTNIAVSAGAGTGKSTTLKNKVVELINSGRFKPADFLIVTFTNDAANSLKNKIKVGIREADGSDELIAEVDSMHVDTIDAFRLFIVKKYAKELGLTGNIGVFDSDVMLLEEYKTLEKMLEVYYENEDPILQEIVDNYLVKNDNGLVKLILNAANTLNVEGKTKQECVDEYVNTYLDTKVVESKINEGLFIYYSKLQKLFVSLNDLINKIPVDDNGDRNKDTIYLGARSQYILKAKTLNDLIEGYKYYLETKEVSYINYKGKEKTIKSRGGGDYDIKAQVNATLDEINDYSLITSENAIKVDLPLNQKYMPFLIGIAYDLKVYIDNFMKEHGVYRFSDISKLALRALEFVGEKGEPRVLNEIKNSFKMIMIDEYQDNSDEDDAFFTRISESNLFLVGDVKQSIYGFKGANPGKFNDKYIQYSNDNKVKHPENPDPYTMNINYRSRREILDGTNEIFGNFMDLNYGGVNYKNDHHELVYHGNDLFDLSPATENKDKGIKKIMLGEKSDLLERYNSLVAPKDKLTEDDLKKNEYYLTAALNIIDRINKHAKVAKVIGKDEDGKKIYGLVDASYRDFAVLSRNNVKDDTCRKIFSALGIPVNIIADEEITQDVMVVTLMSFLNLINLLNNDEGSNKLIDDKYVYVHNNEVQIKHFYTSILRSFVVKASDQEIYEQLADKKSGEITNFAFRETEFYKDLVKFANEHMNSSLSELVIAIINKYNFVEKLASLGNAISSIQKLTKLLEKIKAMDDVGYTLSDLSYFFDNMSKLDLKFEARLGNDSTNAVTIETFHKSKGLEFPIIYIDCTDDIVESKDKTNMLSKKGNNTSFYGNPNVGFFLPSKTADEKLSKTFLISLYEKMLEDKSSISEETRLFYVALTRAKEVAVCVFPKRDLPIDHNNKGCVNTYADMIEFSSYKIEDDEYLLSDKPLEVSLPSASASPTVNILNDNITYNEIEKKAHHPSIEVDNEVNDKLLKLGTRFHAYMQYVDFNTKDTSFIKVSWHRSAINKVLTLDVFKDVKNAKLYREYKYYDEDTDETGSIDLLIVYPDRCVVVDYKLKNADEVKYASQLNSYKTYVEKVFKKPTDAVLISLLGN